MNLERGRTLAEQRDAGHIEYLDLNWQDQELVENYDTGKAKKILTALEDARSPIYRGMRIEAST